MPKPAACLKATVDIVPEPHLLSEESAQGYGQLLASAKVSSPLIILPASRQLSLESAKKLRQIVRRGSWLILESGAAFSRPEESRAQARILAESFGLKTGEPITPSIREASYLTYDCPERTMVRTFGAIVPIACSRAEQLAEYTGVPVAVRRPMGRGGIIYLGSILGAGLLAQEREAHAVASALLRV